MAASSVTTLRRPAAHTGDNRGEAAPLPASAPSPSTFLAIPPARLRGPHAITVVVGVMLMQLAVDLVTGRESARILARLAFMTLELPLLMVALSSAFRWCLRRRMSSWQGLLTGVMVATLFGITFGLLYGALAKHVPDLRLHFPNGDVSFARTSLYGVLNANLYLGLWALAVVFPYAVDNARVRALEAQQLRSEVELARLRVHLEPHFLLNTLNAIAGLVTEEPREARRLIVCLGDLLRDAVHDAKEERDTESVEKQVGWLRRYAEILQTRHKGVLRFEWEIAPETTQVVVPRLLLQPLVENAVKHGALRRGDGHGVVIVRTSTDARGALACVVEDNGPGMPDEDVRAGAFGLQAVRRRLALQAPNASLRLESSNEGTRSIVEFPLPEVV
jgi:signal transduction histidine kinase